MKNGGLLDSPPTPKSLIRRIWWRFTLLWRPILGIILPIVLLPLVFIESGTVIVIEDGEEVGKKSMKFRAAYAILITALYWMFEIMPLPVTALLPIVLFPFLGVASTKEISPVYFSETNVMFLGAIILALSIEHCNLHMRIALKIITWLGFSPIRLLFGVMCTSAFLSMWMSNTAAVAMLLPILVALLDHFSSENDPDVDEKEKARWHNIRKMLMFGVAYASSIGGTGTIMSAGSNLVFQSIYKDFSDRYDISQGGKYLDMTFATWMAINIPAMILNVLVSFIYLAITCYGLPNVREWPLVSRFFKNKPTTKIETVEMEMEKKRIESANLMLKTSYEKLGPMTFHETLTIIMYLLVTLAWIFRDPEFMKGWMSYINGADIGDGSTAILGMILMFILPKDLTFIIGVPKKGQRYQAVLDWKFVQDNVPWGILLLLGGGFALSAGAQSSGLTDWIGERLSGFDSLPRPAILIIVMILTAAVTEVFSNSLTTSILLPILLQLSRRINLHPLYLTLPTTVASSFAFMLPVATTTNALVFSKGNLEIKDMVKTGAFLNVATVLVYFLVQISLGELIFKYSKFEYVN